MPAIGQLTGRISTMTIGRVGYGLSRELREKVEGEVTAQAIARYRAKAADYAKQFGYARLQRSARSAWRSASRDACAGADAARQGHVGLGRRGLPVEAGKATIVVNVTEACSSRDSRSRRVRRTAAEVGESPGIGRGTPRPRG